MNDIELFTGHLDPIETVDGELVDDTFRAPEPALCDDCGHFHLAGSEDHPALPGAPCGSYLCCH